MGSYKKRAKDSKAKPIKKKSVNSQSEIKRQIIKARPAVITELYEMEPSLLKAGWKKKDEKDEGQNIVITFLKGKYSRFIITCEPLHITWRKFEVNENNEMIRKSLILGVIHYDIRKVEYLKFI